MRKSKELKIHDLTFEPFISNIQIKERVRVLAGSMNAELVNKNPLFLAILNGSFFFAADLLREIKFHCQISFVKLSSYAGEKSNGEPRMLIGLNEEIKGRNVVILEDIIDSGYTMDRLLKHLKEHKPESIKIATLTFKKEALKVSLKPDYVGFEVPNKFIVGYGLDYEQLGRNLKDIYIKKED